MIDGEPCNARYDSRSDGLNLSTLVPIPHADLIRSLNWRAVSKNCNRPRRPARRLTNDDIFDGYIRSGVLCDNTARSICNAALDVPQ